jgi:DNA repair protein RadC
MIDKMDVVSIRIVRDGSLLSNLPIDGPEAAVRALGDYLKDMDKEVVCIINIGNERKPVNCSFISVGTGRFAYLDVKDVFKSAVLSGAKYMLMLHNHPSGDLHPSTSDVKLTDKVLRACQLMDIPLLDHVIVGGDNKSYFSFQSKGLIDYDKSYYNFETDYRCLDFPTAFVADPDSAIQQFAQADSCIDCSQQNTEQAVRRHRGR